ncbi:MAG: PAS domain S-box protein [Bacteroidales bacterium]|nr:PAS domain S-box protein [Bacteroidales bacterium]
MEQHIYKEILQSAPFAYACHRIKYDQESIGIELFVTDANKQFEDLCMSDKQTVINRCLPVIMPGLSVISDNWPAMMGEIAIKGLTRQLEYIHLETGKQYTLQLFSANKDHCVTLFHEIPVTNHQEELMPEDGDINFMDLFETMALGAVYQNADGEIIRVNQAAERILGLSKDQLQGRSSIDPAWKSMYEDGSAYPGDEHPAMVALKTGKPVSGKIMGIFNPASNKTSWIIIDAIPQFRTGETTPFRVHVTFLDITERKIAEDLLRESEEKMRSIYRIAPAGIGIMCQRKFISVNSETCEMTGYTEDELIGADARILYPSKEDYEYVGKEKYRQIGEKGTGSVSTRWKRKDGRIINIILSSTAIDPNNLDKGVVYTAVDISERQKAEKSLVESEEKFRAAFFTSPDLLSITSLSDGTYLDVNEAFIKASGFTRDEIIGNSAHTLNIWYNPEDRKKMTDLLKEKGSLVNFETEFRQKGGTTIHGLMSASILTLGGKPHLLAFTRDITDRKVMENALRYSEELYRTVVSASADGIILRAKSGKILTWNKAAERIFGITSEKAFNQIFDNRKNFLYREDDTIYPGNEHPSGITLSTGEPIRNVQMKIKKEYGDYYWINVNTNPVFSDDSGKPSSVVIAFTDITNLKLAQNALRASAEVVKSIPSGLFIFKFEEPDKFYLSDANPAALHLTKIQPERIIGKELNEVWPDISNASLSSHFLNVIQSSEPYFRNNLPFSNSLTEGIFRITAFKMPNNRLGVAFEDVTELKTAEDQLINAKERAEENEVLLRAIIENAPFEIWARNKHDIGILENQNSVNSIGSILGQKPGSAGTPAEISALWKSNNKRVFKGEIIDEECDITVEGEKRIYQQIIAPIVTATGIDGIVGFNINITDKILARQAIDNERKTLRTLIETIPDHVFMKDLDGRYITCNSRFESLAGISGKELEGKTDYDVFPKDMADSFRYHDRKAIELNKPVMNHESVTFKGDGHIEMLETYKAPAYNASGKLIGILGISRDVSAVQKTQEALKEREEIYSSIVNQASDSIGLIDIETGRFVEFNHSAYQTLGYTQDEFSRMRIIDIEARQTEEDIKNSFIRIKETDGYTFETCHRHKSGKILDVRSSARIINIRGKEYISAIWSDITGQKRTEAMMIEKDLIFQSLMDNSPIYIFFKDHLIKSLYLSRNFEQMLGKPLNELIGKDMNELFPSDIAVNMIKDDQKILNQKQLVEVDEDFNGRYYTTIKFPIFRKDKPPMLAGFTIDITERQHAQHALRQSERILKQAQQIANMGSFEFDIEKGTSVWSENLYKIFDTEPSGKSGATLRTIIPSNVIQDDIAVTEKVFKDALEGLCPYELDFRVRREDGSIRYMHSRADFERDGTTNKPVRMIGLIQDITERKKAEEEIILLNESLEKRVEERTLELQVVNHELEAFAYTVSHDLRAPLRAINGFTNILKEDFSKLLNADGMKLIETITENAGRMGLLIDDLLTFSRLSRSEMNLVEVDMNHLVKIAYQELTDPEQRALISFNTEKLPSVMADNSLIKQVWLNLISNAIKFSSKTEKPVITISAIKETDKIIYKVSDNGVGFNIKYAAKLFGVFQRLHSVREFEGTGAGLAIVQRIIIRHGGKVWATSELGKGACFYFSLPE